MTDKIKELLAVLDMPEEDKQLMWLKEHREEFGIDNHPASYPLEGFPRAAKFFLADLAFRLRDEWAGKIFSRRMYLQKGLRIVCEYESEKLAKTKKITVAFDYWLSLMSQPIHWIIAALIAKELAKDG